MKARGLIVGSPPPPKKKKMDLDYRPKLLTPSRKLKNLRNFQKLLNKTSPKKIDMKTSRLIQKLLLLYIKDGIKRGANYAEKQAKDYVDGECFDAIEEKLRAEYG